MRAPWSSVLLLFWLFEFYFNRVQNCDVINYICGTMAFGRTTSGLLAKNFSIVGQIVFEILAQLCSDDSIQILLNLTWCKRLDPLQWVARRFCRNLSALPQVV